MLSLIVLTRKTMRSSTYSYLSALSVCDTLVLILTMVLLIKDVDKPVKGEDRWPWDEGIYPYLFPYVHPAAFSFQVGYCSDPPCWVCPGLPLDILVCPENDTTLHWVV